MRATLGRDHMAANVYTDVLDSDHGVIVLAGDVRAESWEDNSLLLVGVEEAMGDLWINTGSQWGPFEVTTALLESEAPLRDDYEDIVELSIEALGPVVVTELDGGGLGIPVVSSAGSYRLRVSARGRLHDRDRGDEDGEQELGEDPVEWYLVETWPAEPADRVVHRMRSVYALDYTDEPQLLNIPEAAAGLAASQRIGRDVDGAPGARTLSGDRGSVTLTRRVRGTRRKMFLVVSHVTSWSGWRVMENSWIFGGGGEHYELGALRHAYSSDTADQLTGRTGTIISWFTEVDRPRRAVRLWNWGVKVPGRPAWDTDMLLPTHTRVTTTLETTRDAHGDSWTTIVHEHSDVPVEWVDDLRDWWTMQLAIHEVEQEAEFRRAASRGS